MRIRLHTKEVNSDESVILLGLHDLAVRHGMSPEEVRFAGMKYTEICGSIPVGQAVTEKALTPALLTEAL